MGGEAGGGWGRAGRGGRWIGGRGRLAAHQCKSEDAQRCRLAVRRQVVSCQASRPTVMWITGGCSSTACDQETATPLQPCPPGKCSIRILPGATRPYHEALALQCPHPLPLLPLPPQDGFTPLFVACQNGHLEVAQLLLDAGANKDAANEVRGQRRGAAGGHGWAGRVTHETGACRGVERWHAPQYGPVQVVKLTIDPRKRGRG